MTEKITMDGKYQTRDGRKARIICLDAGRADDPVVGLVSDEGVEDSLYTFSGYGRCRSGVDGDSLVSAPKRIQGWANLYHRSRIGDTFYATQQQALAAAHGTGIACIYIDAEEGTGLEQL